MNVAAAPAPTEGITLKHGSDLHLGGVVDPIAEVEGHVVDVGEQHPADSDLYAIVRSIDLKCLLVAAVGVFTTGSRKRITRKVDYLSS